MFVDFSHRHIKKLVLDKLNEQDRRAYRLAAMVNGVVLAVLSMLATVVLTLADVDPQTAASLAIASSLEPGPAVHAMQESQKQ